jgi:hypothetical protein
VLDIHFWVIPPYTLFSAPFNPEKAPFGAFLLQRFSQFYIVGVVVNTLWRCIMIEKNGIEEKINLLNLRDGLADIFMAIILLAFGIGIRFDMAWLTGIMAAVLYPVWQGAKAQIIAPRVERAGQLQQIEGRNVKISRGVMALLTGSLLLGLVFFALFSFGRPMEGVAAWLRANFELAFGSIIAVFLALFGAILSAWRFIAYAALALILFLAGSFLALPLWITMTACGALILLAGAGVFIQFLRQNPL